ncbi:efflux RND transporter periplasmic adaptor subunit [Methylotuvimicrobium sp.]|uniref:efflux RND transporter periplasmic adaptor subunit n=1 Tax=Methylotuvimicrobium sp. TaxID=2822413 RepID=UPI003D65C0C9
MNTRQKVVFIGVAVLLAVFSAMTLTGHHSTGDTVPKSNNAPSHWAGPFGIDVTLIPEKPKVGKNTISLFIRDKDLQPVSDARIKAVSEMPAMGSMPAMPVPIEMKMDSPGHYRGHYELPMAGYWPLTLSIRSEAKGSAQLTFDMSTGRKGVELTSSTASDHQPRQVVSGQAVPQQPGTFTIDAHRRQLIGVTTGRVGYRQLIKTIRSPAQIVYDETRLTDISLKFDGWIGELNADYVGKVVKKGQALLTVYNPQLVATQEEYLDSLRRSDERLGNLADAARRRMTLWGIAPAQIQDMARRGKALEYLTIASPVSGTLVEKHIVAGSAVKAGMPLLRIADLSKVWVDAQVYESDLPWLKPGMRAEVVLEDQPDRRFCGTIDFIEPSLDHVSRSARVRMTLPNSDGELRPDRYARMNLQIDLGKRLLVPEQAVIYAGEKRVVFVDLGEGRLLPKKIKTGLRNADYIEVLEGLVEGDEIVTSGNFLIASESKLKSGLEQW